MAEALLTGWCIGRSRFSECRLLEVPRSKKARESTGMGHVPTRRPPSPSNVTLLIDTCIRNSKTGRRNFLAFGGLLGMEGWVFFDGGFGRAEGNPCEEMAELSAAAILYE
jgi:hypothetical protein